MPPSPFNRPRNHLITVTQFVDGCWLRYLSVLVYFTRDKRLAFLLKTNLNFVLFVWNQNEISLKYINDHRIEVPRMYKESYTIFYKQEI